MGDPSTDIAGGARKFPKTQWTVIRDAADRGSATWRTSLEELAGTYWRPVYAYFRRKWSRSNEEAKDLTQEFFLTITTTEFLKRPTPDKGRFRSYVMGALDRFAARDFHRRKRETPTTSLAIDFGDGFEPVSSVSPEDLFRREWAASVLNAALLEMERDCTGEKRVYLELLKMHDIERPEGADVSYDGLAQRFGIKVTDVNNFLFRARKKLRDFIKNKVRETVSTESEADLEMEELFRGLEAG